MRAQPDDRLVALAREGREAAFEEIVRRYRGGLVPFAAAFAPSDRAEDVVQESLVRAWEALRTSESEIRLKPWLYTIVRNRALNARRDTRTHEQLDETIDGVRQPSEIVLTRRSSPGSSPRSTHCPRRSARHSSAARSRGAPTSSSPPS